MKNLLFLFYVILSASSLMAFAHPKSVEVLHWWTSGGEANAINVLKENVQKQGYIWKDAGSVLGGGGDQQRKVLHARIEAHSPPDAIMIQSNTMHNYAENNLLSSLDAIAQQEKWKQLLSPPLQNTVMYKNHWLAIPINIHRSHWIWANKKIFDKLNIKPPRTLSELMSVSKTIQKAGYIPIAHGGQPWQDVILFDSTVLSIGGTAFYKKALYDFNTEALGSKTMETVFEQLRQLQSFFDKDYFNREWHLATAMVIHEKAAMQIMGDWVKGEFIKAGKKPNQDFLCFEFPGTQNNFLFISDLFGFPIAPQKQLDGQTVLIKTMMDKKFQEDFNLVKGSIPARMDVSLERFDECAQKSSHDFKKALKQNTAIRHFDTVISDMNRKALYKIISDFIHNPQLSAKAATRELQRCLAASNNKNEIASSRINCG
ncbi:MAG: ABC transporter substrate-binding protein [Pseudomonadota bacterium]